MSVRPDVSVVVPTWNRAHTLAASLASLCAQEGVALEVVVVDDGSTDDTPALLAGLAAADARIRVVHGAHAGIAAARNAGIAAATAPYVAFHDSDDTALPGRLAVPVGYLRAHDDVDMVVMNGRLLPPEDEPDGVEQPWVAPEVARTLTDRPIGVAEVFRWNLGQLQGMTFTRRALDAVGPLDASFRILDDLDLALRVAARFRAVFLDRMAFAYRRHAGGIARDRATVREESIRLADKLVRTHPDVLAALGRDAFRKRQARRWARLAASRAKAGDAVAARAAMAEARRLDPASLRWRWRALWLRLRGDA
jgi:glycosyltransferase involved in cell wall biosynthesis